MIIRQFIKLLFYYIGIVIIVTTFAEGDQYCLTSMKSDDNDLSVSNGTCTKESLQQLRNNVSNKSNTSFGYQVNSCDRTYVFDLGVESTTPDDFDNLKYFVYQSLLECLDRNIGHSIFFSVFNDGTTSKKCCGKVGCLHAINELEYDSVVKNFNNTTLIWNETTFANNYSREFLNQLKKFEEQYCSKNSVVFITNRIVKLEPDGVIFSNIQQVLNYYCSSLTIMLIGREDSTYDILKTYYGNISQDLYNVPDSSCTENLVECIVPCHSMLYERCSSQNFTSCNHPDHLPTIAPKPTQVIDPDPNTAHIIYIFGISANMTQKHYSKMQDMINSSVYECFVTDYSKISVMFINYDIAVTTDWLDTPDNIGNSLNLETLNDIALNVNFPVDNTSYQITKMMKVAVNILNNGTVKSTDKRIILLTDFVSLNFTYSFADISTSSFKGIFFQVYCFTEICYNYYKYDTIFDNGDTYYIPLIGVPDKIHLCTAKSTTTTQKPSAGVGTNITIILVATFGTCAILFFILCGGTVLYRNRVKNINLLEQSSDFNCDDLAVEGADIYEIRWNNLFYSSEKIGNGAYGQVYKGTYMGIPLTVTKVWKTQPSTVIYKNSMPIAIKILPKIADEKARENFLHEIEIMKKIGYHDNIIGMVGCITKSQPIALIMEYCENKDLHRFVKNMKADLLISNNSVQKRISNQLCLLTFCMQITSGMKFLVSKGIIHRDLAARNILIDGNNIIKIGDFGLCIEVNNNDSVRSVDSATAIHRKNGVQQAQHYKTQKLPIKWLSPESLKYTIFMFKSDIWSFGMVVYEMYSFGEVPFDEIEPTELLDHITKGNRPQRPEFASEEIYNIMHRCWKENPEDRPTFDELMSEFMVLLENTTDTDLYVELLSSSMYYKNVSPILDDVSEGGDNSASSDGKKPLKQSLSAHGKIGDQSDSNVSRSKTMLLPNFVKRLSRDFTNSHFPHNPISRKDSFFYDDQPRRKSESIVSGARTSTTFMSSFNELKKTLTNSTSRLFSKRE
uniref:Tyrosine-protein kinase receptor torso (inferred by orthology to a D. melanogaster protein) n=1 Tax=Strongyloides venezuelensis TaxID=75913 RepID=A0A0K0FNZ7_STRVS